MRDGVRVIRLTSGFWSVRGRVDLFGGMEGGRVDIQEETLEPP